MTTKRTEQVLAALRGANPSAPAEPAGEPALARSRRGGVRFTFDVSREQHRFIRQFVLDSETTASAATRALWALVQEDSALAERLRGSLAFQDEAQEES
jgi:hypothetical protein